MCILGNLWKMKTSFYLPSFMSVEDHLELARICVDSRTSARDGLTNYYTIFAPTNTQLPELQRAK
jgi:hypothetical protein